MTQQDPEIVSWGGVNGAEDPYHLQVYGNMQTWDIVIIIVIHTHNSSTPGVLYSFRCRPNDDRVHIMDMGCKKRQDN